MNTFLLKQWSYGKYLTQLFIVLLIFSCGSDDDNCTKTITIPQIFFVGNQSYLTSIEQQVSCDVQEPDDPEIIEPPILENFTYQILSFNYQQDTGNNTTRLQFEIQLNNPNNFNVSGVPLLSISTGGIDFTASYSNDATVPCLQLLANSSCILTYDVENSLNNVIPPSTFEITDVAYVVID